MSNTEGLQEVGGGCTRVGSTYTVTVAYVVLEVDNVSLYLNVL